jgi:hypothetical protein
VTVKTAPPASEAEAVAGVSVPLAHTRETVTLAGSLGTKSLLTVNVALLSVLTIVHEPAMSAAEQFPLEL